jgi:DNA-binding PadR family transcriptional regulator
MPRTRGRRRKGGRRAVETLKPPLLFLHTGPAHGYTLLEQLEQSGPKGLNPSAAYRAPRDMEARGWPTSGWD